MWVEDEVPSYVQDSAQYNHVGQTCRRGLYVRPLPPPGASTVLMPKRTRELTYQC